MMEVLGKAPEALIATDLKVFYKSILGTFQHIVLAELSWLRRYATFFAYPSLSGSPLLARDQAALKEESGKNLEALRSLCAETDALFAVFAAELDEADLGKRVNYKNMHGVDFERTYGDTIFHVLNHGTHHRGEISALLDMNGVTNDVSGFTLYIK